MHSCVMIIHNRMFLSLMIWMHDIFFSREWEVLCSGSFHSQPNTTFYHTWWRSRWFTWCHIWLTNAYSFCWTTATRANHRKKSRVLDSFSFFVNVSANIFLLLSKCVHKAEVGRSSAAIEEAGVLLRSEHGKYFRIFMLVGYPSTAALSLFIS